MGSSNVEIAQGGTDVSAAPATPQQYEGGSVVDGVEMVNPSHEAPPQKEVKGSLDVPASPAQASSIKSIPKIPTIPVLEKISSWKEIAHDYEGHGPDHPGDAIGANAVGNALGDKLGAEPLTWKGAFMVQLITMIGAGILFYPAIFASLGFVLSVIYLTCAAFMNGGFVLFFYYTIQRLKKINPDAKIENLEDVGQIVFGTWFKWVYWAFVYVTLFILASTFLMLVGELMTGFGDLGTNGADIYNVPVSQFYWSLIFGIPQLVLAWVPDLKGLKYVLNLGIVAISIVIINHVVLCAVAIGDDPVASDPDATEARAFAEFPAGIETWKLLLGGITTFVYGFGAIIVSGQVINDMGPNHTQFPKATITAHAVVWSIYMLFGSLGYAAFGTAPPDSFLSPDSLIFDEYYTYWAIGSACTITNVCVTIPIFFNSLNRGLVRLLPEDKQENWVWVYTMRTCVVLCSMAVACTPVSYFDDLTGLIPMCTVACISLIFPAMLYWGGKAMELGHNNGKEQKDCYGDCIKKQPWLFALHTVIVLIAVVGVIFGFWVSLEGLIDNINGV